MTGTIDLTADGKSLLIRFSYREDLVEQIRLIPGRRWDREERVWRVPADEADQVVGTFQSHGFSIAPEVEGLLALAENPPATGDGLPFDQVLVPEAPPALSISVLNERVRLALRRTFHDPIWVVGEVLGFDKSKNRKHVFFSLTEKRAGSNQPAAQAEVAMFASTLERLRPVLGGGDGLTLRDGIEIRALVRVDLYPGSGRYQLVLEDIDPSFTLGKMALTREALLGELRQKGLHTRNSALALPAPPLRVGVLTSPDSDGWNDLLQQLRGSGSGFRVTCYAVSVQGAATRPSVLAGLRWFARRHTDFDVLCIVRGGGSRTDLSWFDDRDLALAVARQPLKIVCGIGHERDQSVLDLIAHSEKTPTAVGAMLVDAVREADTALEERAAALVAHVAEILAEGKLAIGRRGSLLSRAVGLRVARDRERLANNQSQLGRWTSALLAQRLDGLRLLHRDVAHHVQRVLERGHSRLAVQQERQRLLDPKRVLERGYALVRTAGAVVVSARTLRSGMVLDIRFQDGHARVKTLESAPDAAPE